MIPRHQALRPSAAGSGTVLVAAILAVLACAVTASGQIPGAVAHWSFDNPAQPGADSIGGHHGTLAGPAGGPSFTPDGAPMVAGNAGCLAFGGSHTITVPHAADISFGTGEPMMPLWCKRTGAAQMNIFGKRAGCYEGNYQLAWDYAHQTHFSSGYATATILMANPPYTLPLNVWTHLAATWDGISRIVLYINGVAANSSNIGLCCENTSPLVIGSSGTCTQGLIGLMDDVWIFGRALAPTEVDALRAGLATPLISFGQPAGSGTALFGTSSNLIVGHEYFNLFSGDWPPYGLGTGPYGGLYFIDVSFLIFQLDLPVGALPVHFLATANTAVFGPHYEPIGLTFDAICVDFTAGVVGPISPAVRYSVY